MLTKSDLKVGAGGPWCEVVASDVGRPVSGLLATNRSGLGGGRNVGGIGGANELIEASADTSGRFHSLPFVKVEL